MGRRIDADGQIPAWLGNVLHNHRVARVINRNKPSVDSLRFQFLGLRQIDSITARQQRHQSYTDDKEQLGLKHGNPPDVQNQMNPDG
jgi:hypothetical protein